jgi:hypothetical protein
MIRCAALPGDTISALDSLCQVFHRPMLPRRRLGMRPQKITRTVRQQPFLHGLQLLRTQLGPIPPLR